MSRVEQIGDATLYLGDCRTILPAIERVSCVVTDPPYGVKMDKGFGGFGGFGAPIARRQYDDDWDADRPDQETFAAICGAADRSLIFGGNFFADLLPRGGHWIVWDKLNTMPSFGDCELIWSNVDRKSVKKIVYEYNGLLGKEDERVHPTQKPVALISRIVETYTKPGETVLDPFMGSGTAGVACVRLGRKFVGIELDETHFETACKRIRAAERQPDLFVERPKPLKQDPLPLQHKGAGQ